MTTLVVTNDFPPRVGGIETFVRHVCGFLDDRVVVLTRTERDASATRTYDASLPFPVHRLPGPLLPTPSVARRAGAQPREDGAEQVVFGAVLTGQRPRPARDRRRGQQRTRKAMNGEREALVVRAGGGRVELCTGEDDHTVVEEATDVANECLDTANAGREVVRDDERRHLPREPQIRRCLLYTSPSPRD